MQNVRNEIATVLESVQFSVDFLFFFSLIIELL
jgi:hypothetical protein